MSEVLRVSPGRSVSATVEWGVIVVMASGVPGWCGWRRRGCRQDDPL